MKVQGKQAQGLAELIASLFDDIDSWSFPYPLRALRIFVPVCSNRLTVAMAMAVRGFHKHSSKIRWRKIHLNYRIGA